MNQNKEIIKKEFRVNGLVAYTKINKTKLYLNYN